MTGDTKPPDRSRRGFLNWLLGTSIGGLLVVMGIPVSRYLIPPEASESATATVRLATCTHLACTVQYREDIGHIWCACHNGHFDLNGLNISGPPPRPLDQFVVNETADQIVVSKGT
jgi:Rieske Fe-S protein